MLNKNTCCGLIKKEKPEPKLLTYICTGTYQKFQVKFRIYQEAKYIPELEGLYCLSIIYMTYYMLVDRISSKDYRRTVHSHREIDDK